jgi:hypothetical protein
MEVLVRYLTLKIIKKIYIIFLKLNFKKKMFEKHNQKAKMVGVAIIEKERKSHGYRMPNSRKTQHIINHQTKSKTKGNNQEKVKERRSTCTKILRNLEQKFKVL